MPSAEARDGLRMEGLTGYLLPERDTSPALEVETMLDGREADWPPLLLAELLGRGVDSALLMSPGERRTSVETRWRGGSLPAVEAEARDGDDALAGHVEKRFSSE